MTDRSASRRLSGFAALAASLALSACEQLNAAAGAVADSAAPADSVTGQRDLNMISAEEEATLGREFEQGILADAQANGFAVDADEKTRQQCLAVMQRIVAVSHRPDQQITLHLIERPDWNACATLGGYVFVYRGLIAPPNGLQTWDELAAVLGHEWGHVTGGHVSKSVSRERLDPMMKKSQVYAASFRFVGGQEDQADQLGVLYAALAGFDPNAATRIWTRMLRLSGPDAPGALQVHPLTQDRVVSTQRYGQLAAKYYVAGQINPDAKNILAANDVVPRQQRTEGLLALLEAGARYYGEGASAKVEGQQRMAALRQQELQFPGYQEATRAHVAGDYQTAANGYVAILNQNPNHSLAAYNLARIAAMSGQGDLAIQLLQRSVQCGFDDAKFIANDAQLANVRRDPRFRQIVDYAGGKR